MDVFCVSFVFTAQIEFNKCCVWFQWFTQWRCSSFFNVVPCWWEEKRERVSCWWMSFVCLLSFVFTTQIEYSECCVWFQWFTQWCCSCVSNAVPYWNEEKRKRKANCWWVFCASSFLLSSPSRSSAVSVVFDFSDSLNDVAPVSPILLSVDEMKVIEWIVDGCLLCVFFYLHHPDQVQWVLCLISMIRSMPLLQCLQSCCLLMRI